jgi:hypothetical protein
MVILHLQKVLTDAHQDIGVPNVLGLELGSFDIVLIRVNLYFPFLK